MGSEWQPIRDITFRGNYTRSIRAPSITNLFNPTSGIFTTADDPCDTRFIAGGPNPSQRAANCAAAGIGPGFQSNIVGATARGTLSGNTNLTNERADSYTFGAVIRPRFIPGLTISADWISIKLKNAIVELDATQVMQACYDSGGYPNTFCQQFTRDAEHQVTFIKTGYYNAASYEFRGIVAQADYTVSTPFLGADSKINIGLNYQYVDKLQQEVGLGSLTTLRGSIGYSKNKGTATVTYINDAFAWQWQAQYYGPAQIDPDAAPNTYNYPSVGAVTFFNTTVAFNVNKTFKMQLIVDNVFDKKPPFPAPGGGGTITYFDGILGRYFKMGASVRF
jgi:outer membrane receptor protein involved in Fe transport